MPEGVGYDSEVTAPPAAQPAHSISDAEHSQIIQMFEDSEETGRDNRQLQERDSDYYHNIQLTAQEKAELRRRGQPELILNHVQSKVDFLLGLESQQRTDPKAVPRNPNDEEASEAATDALRYEADSENLDQIFSSAWEDILIPGFCCAEVNIKETRRGIEVWVEHHHWDYSFADPHSRKHDYADARYKGVVKWMDAEEAIEQWPHAADGIENMFEGEKTWSFEDKPSHKVWTQSGTTGGKRRRVRVVQICWKVRDAWKWAIFSKGAVFVGGDVPFVDQDGNSDCPLIMQSAYVDRQNNRYGTVRSMISPQDEINARRSKALHMLNARQTYGRNGAVDDVDEAKRQMARSDGHVEINGEFGVEFGVFDNSLQLQGQFELLQEAKAEMDRAGGANNALQGHTGETSSGRAIQASQQGGMISIAKLRDRHSHFKNQVYRAIWNRIRQYWTEEKWIRVTDDEDNIKFVGFNRTITKAEKLIEDAEKEGMPKQEAEQRLQQAIQQNPAIIQDLQTPIQVNVAADMDMDINVEEVPDVVSIQQEQFDMLAKILASGIEPGSPAFRALVMASSLRDKDKLLETFEGKQAPTPEQQQQAQIQQRAQEIQLEGAELANEKTKVEIAKIASDAQGTPSEPVDPELIELDKEQRRATIEKTRADGVKSLADADSKDGVMGNLMTPQPAQQSAA